MNIGKLLDLTNDFMPKKKCWVFPCMIRAIANAAGKTSDELMDELGIQEEEVYGRSCEHNISQSTVLGSERINRVSRDELGPGDWHEEHSDYTFAPGA